MATIAGRFHEVKGWGGQSESLPPGPDYVFQIDVAQQGQSPKKGTPQLELELTVLNEGELNGRKAFHRLTLNLEKETPRKRMRQLIDATGVPMDGNGNIDDADFVGRIFMADVVEESYEDVDATTGTKISKTAIRVVNERIPPGAEGGQAAAAPSTAAAALAAPAAPAAQTRQAPAAPAPAAPAAGAAPANGRPVYAPPTRGGAGLTRV